MTQSIFLVSFPILPLNYNLTTKVFP